MNKNKRFVADTITTGKLEEMDLVLVKDTRYNTPDWIGVGCGCEICTQYEPLSEEWVQASIQKADKR